MILEAMLSAALGGVVYGYMESIREKKEEIKLEKEKLEEYKQKQQALLEREAFLETL